MKNRIFLVALLACSSVAAQVGPGSLTYRQSDPFLFCHDGQDLTLNPDRCWYPVAPFTGGGAFMINVWCEPNPYGEPWDADDVASLAQYQLVCPVAQRPGEWDTKKGMKDMTPYKH